MIQTQTSLTLRQSDVSSSLRIHTQLKGLITGDFSILGCFSDVLLFLLLFFNKELVLLW